MSVVLKGGPVVPSDSDPRRTPSTVYKWNSHLPPRSVLGPSVLGEGCVSVGAKELRVK